MREAVDRRHRRSAPCPRDCRPGPPLGHWAKGPGAVQSGARSVRCGRSATAGEAERKETVQLSVPAAGDAGAGALVRSGSVALAVPRLRLSLSLPVTVDVPLSVIC